LLSNKKETITHIISKVEHELGIPSFIVSEKGSDMDVQFNKTMFM